MTVLNRQTLSEAGVGHAQRIAILVLPSFSNLTLAALMEPLRGANRWAGRPLFEWSTATERGEAIVSSSGCRVGVENSRAVSQAVAAQRNAALPRSRDHCRSVSKPHTQLPVCQL